MLPAVLLLSIALLTGGVRSFNDEDSVMRIPIRHKRKSSGNSLNNFLLKRFSNQDFEELEGANKIDVIIANNQNAEFYGEVTFGTPPQKFQMTFETGTRHILIPSENCYNCKSRRYNSSASSTYEANGKKISFPDWTKGFLSRDTVCIGGQCMAGEYFIEVTFFMGHNDKDTKADGVIGMTPSEKTTLGVNTFFQSLLEQKKISNPVFAFWFNWNSNESGELILGGVDKARYVEPITYVNLTGQNNWMINMEGVMVNSTVVACTNKCKAEINTASPFIMGGMVETDAILKPLGFSYWPIPSGKIYYMKNCTEKTMGSYPDISFVIDGKKYVFTSEDYLFMLEIDGVPHCVSYIFGVASYDFNDWIFGPAFMKKYYTAFDYGQKRLGFAEVKKEQKKKAFKWSTKRLEMYKLLRQTFGPRNVIPY